VRLKERGELTEARGGGLKKKKKDRAGLGKRLSGRKVERVKHPPKGEPS